MKKLFTSVIVSGTILMSSLLVGFAQSPTPANIGIAPALWLRADLGVTQSAGTVVIWADQSGNGNDNTQIDPSIQPGYNDNGANFNPTVTFNGSQYVAAPNGLLDPAVNYTSAQVFIVQNSTSGWGNRALYGQYIMTNDGSNGRFMAHGELSGTQYFGLTAPLNNWVSLPASADRLDAYVQNTFRVSGNIQELWFNGGDTITTANNYSSFTAPYSGIPWATGAAPASDPTYSTPYSFFQLGSICELIVFKQALTDPQRLKIETYLGVKYGNSLLHNYYTSVYNGSNAAAATVYDISTYGNNIAGIARDDSSKIYQKQSRSQNSVANSRMITMGIDTIAPSNALNTNTLTNGTYVIWGDDNGAVTETSSNIIPAQAKRLTRQWKVQVKGTSPTNMVVKFDLSGLTLSGTSLNDYKLVVDRDGDGDFTTGTIDTYSPASGSTLSSMSFKNVKWDSDGNGKDVFTLKTFLSAPAPTGPTPANIGIYPALWLRADIGVSQTAGVVDNWSDQSGYGNDNSQSTPANQPGYNNNGANFNPTVTFNGSQWVAAPNGLLNPAVNYTATQIFVVHNSTSGQSNRGLYGQYIQAEISGTKPGRLMAHGEFNGTQYFGLSAAGNDWVSLPALADRLDAYVLNTFRVDASNQKLWFNGADSIVNTNHAASFTTPTPRAPWSTGVAPEASATFNNPYNFKQLGAISELMVFTQALTEPQRLKIETYLGVKYGNSLLHNYYTSDYTGSNAAATTVYDISTYGNNIAGIARDDSSQIYQKQSRSQNSVANSRMITMGIDTIALSNAINANALTNGTYVIWGDDNGDVTETSSNIIPAQAKRLTRQWKVQVKGTSPTNMVVKFDLSGLTLSGTSLNDYKLVVDRDGDGDFTTGTIDTYSPASGSTLSSMSFKNVKWDSDGNGKDVFTLKTKNGLSTYKVTGGGSFCSCATGVSICLSGSDQGTIYELRHNHTSSGITLIESNPTMTGTGSSICFGPITEAGTYKIYSKIGSPAVYTQMLDSAIVTVNPLPTAYTVTGGGTFCTGGSGMAVGLSNSKTGIKYQLKQGGTDTGSPLKGTGSAISFGLQTVAGTYTVLATDTITSCQKTMTGSATVKISTPPNVAAIGGGALSVCVNSKTLAFTDATKGGVWSVVPVTGSASITSGGVVTGLTAGTVNVTYTVTSGCSAFVTKSLTINDLPATPASITGTTSVCAGSTTALADITAGGVWSSSSTSVATVSGTGVVTGVAAGTTTIYYTVSNGSNCTNRVSTTVTVNPRAAQPSAFTKSSASVTQGQTNVAYSVTNVSGITYNWSYSGTGATITGGTTSSVTISFSKTATAGTLSVTATNGCGTSSARSLTITMKKYGTKSIDLTNVTAALNPDITTLEDEFTVYPNPTSGSATFSFKIAESGRVRIDLYSINGQHNAHIFDADVEAGIPQTVLYNQNLPAGIYPCILTYNGKSFSLKLAVRH
jgi:PKD-like domain/Bacterial Ig-like domain (group 2)